MAAKVFVSLFQYLNAWLLIAFVAAMALAAEKLYFIVLSAFYKKIGRGESCTVNFSKMFRASVALPKNARRSAAIYCPVLAFAALMTLCACLPTCTYIPIIDNGADVVQLSLFMLLSELFVMIALYSVGTNDALETARLEMRAMVRLFFPFMALCASIAAYLIKNGLDTDPFSFNSFSLFGQMRSMSWAGVASIALFILIAFSQIPQKGRESGTLLFRGGELPEYNGAPRGMLQLWSVVRSFLAISVIVYIVFPSDLMTAFGESAAIAWGGQAVNFVVFWLSVAAVRIVVVPLCHAGMERAKLRLPELIRGALPYALTLIAMLLLWYEGLLLYVEAAAF